MRWSTRIPGNERSVFWIRVPSVCTLWLNTARRTRRFSKMWALSQGVYSRGRGRELHWGCSTGPINHHVPSSASPHRSPLRRRHCSLFHWWIYMGEEAVIRRTHPTARASLASYGETVDERLTFSFNVRTRFLGGANVCLAVMTTWKTWPLPFIFYSSKHFLVYAKAGTIAQRNSLCKNKSLQTFLYLLIIHFTLQGFWAEAIYRMELNYLRRLD